jgi:PPOX class probable F420-dependent enzyme
VCDPTGQTPVDGDATRAGSKTQASLLANGVRGSTCARLKMYFAKNHKTAYTSRLGHRTVVRGRIVNCTGKSIVRARIDVVHVVNGKRKLVKTGLRSRSGGNLTLILPSNITRPARCASSTAATSSARRSPRARRCTSPCATATGRWSVSSVPAVSRRDLIKMTDPEVLDFLDEQRTVICATNGRDGWPHLMPLWYVVRDGTVWAWTYAKAQKTRNLERDPRAALQVEAGDTYDQLRGVMLRCEVTLHRETEDVAALGLEIYRRYTGADLADEVLEMVHAQAPKRVALEFVERSRATFDHRKLAGVY